MLMKKKLLICGGILLLKLAVPADAAIMLNSGTINVAVPDGNPVGITSYLTSSTGGDSIFDVSVVLNISGGYNGDLVGYLAYQDTTGRVATEILLNQIGTTPSDPFGADGAGFNVTLSDSGTVNGNIHNATGIPTGTWLPDSANTLDGTFGGMATSGTWTLFLSDVSGGGGTSVLNSWALDVAVPEPADYGALAGLGVTGLVMVNHLRRRLGNSSAK